MQYASINELFTATINNALASAAQFIPGFVTGLIVLLIGLIIASFVKQILTQVFRVVGLESFLQKYGVPSAKAKEGVSWTEILSELARWVVIVVFLIPAADIWGLSQFVVILNGFLAYLPNVVIAVLILLVGFVVSRLTHDVLLASIHGVSQDVARTVAVVGRYAVLVFAVLVVLNQLGIASDLIRILFAGFVAMLALAGGLAFGLGGRDVAKEMLTRLLRRL